MTIFVGNALITKHSTIPNLSSLQFTKYYILFLNQLLVLFIVNVLLFLLGLKTIIEIDYTPPDQYPDYAPPNYRAASSVTLRCRTEGASGSVRYRWSSTCSSCFASSSYSSSVSQSILKSRDSGTHTCTTTDSTGNTGSNSTQMNIVGTCL